MPTAVNTKLLLVIAATLAGIAGSLAWHNARAARADAEHQRFVQEVKAIQKTENTNWGKSAKTVRDYRPK